MVPKRLIAFISSTADLAVEREAIESALSALEIDGVRFETCPSSPNDPLTECLQRIEESDALVLLLGDQYGTELANGLSFTHQEYRHARELDLPVFAFKLKAASPEKPQVAFITEVEAEVFRCAPVRSIEELTAQVRASFLMEYARCFRRVHTPPQQPVLGPPPPAGPLPSMPGTLDGFRRLLMELDSRGDDVSIRVLAEESEREYLDDPQVIGIVFAAEVNLGINGVEVDPRRVTDAIRFWERLLDEAPERSADLKYDIGNALAVLQRFGEAIEQYQAALDEQPAFAECWKNLAAVHCAQDNLDAARHCLERAIAIKPKLPQALYSLATLTIQEGGDLDVALAWLNRIAVTRIPHGMSAAVLAWKAHIYTNLGRFAEGIACVEDALSLDPEPKWAWMIAARLYSLARRQSLTWLPDAIQFWHRFLDGHADVEEAWCELGYAYWDVCRSTDSEEPRREGRRALEKALELGLSDGGLVEDRVGHLCQDEGNWGEAADFFRLAVAKDPSQFGYCLGVSLTALGQFEEALPWILEAAKQHQPDALSWFQVALCYEGLGQTDYAIASYERAIELDESYADAWFNLGGIIWNSGDQERAFTVWQDACRRFPEHERAQEVIEFLARAALMPDADRAEEV